MITATKKPGWEKRLADLFRRKSVEPFAWGKHDCCAFVSEAVLAMTEWDPRSLQVPYASAVSAAHVIRNNGGIDQIPVRSGFIENTNIRMTRRGDVVLAQIEHKGRTRRSLGVCFGQMSVFCSYPRGIAFHPTTSCVKSWRIE